MPLYDPLPLAVFYSTKSRLSRLSVLLVDLTAANHFTTLGALGGAVGTVHPSHADRVAY
jgi:hypothetical protein